MVSAEISDISSFRHELRISWKEVCFLASSQQTLSVSSVESRAFWVSGGYADDGVFGEVHEAFEQQVDDLVVVGLVEAVDHVAQQVQRVDVLQDLVAAGEVL
jgi:hypothetical protein